MTKSKKIWIGILSVLPLLSGFAFIIYMLTTFTTLPFWELDNSDIPPPWFISRMIGFVIIGLIIAFIHLGLMIYFIVHAMSNPQVKSEERIIWILVFIFINSIGFPIYWAIRIWPESKPESNFVKM
jgi:hypothetical protein